MRGSGGVLKVVNTTLSANGRMSEGQAALGLAYLDLCNKECTKQQKAYDVYSKIISKVESVNVLSAQHTSSCEYHKFVVSFDNQEVEAQVLDQLRIKKISIGQMSFDGLRQHKHHGRIHFGLPTNISASEATQLALTIFRRL
jgi:dTDP-4-amino-4,6-dideoxygalactose transaminase